MIMFYRRVDNPQSTEAIAFLLGSANSMPNTRAVP